MNSAEPICGGAPTASASMLVTGRLRMRKPMPADVSALAGLSGHRKIAENLARLPHLLTERDARGVVEVAERAGDQRTFVVEAGEGVIVGVVALSGVDGRAPELGFWMGVRHWGNGYATEAARALVDHAFADLGCRVLHARARVSNPLARRVLEKCGFQWSSVELLRVPSIGASAPFDSFRLEHAIWASLKMWGPMRRVA